MMLLKVSFPNTDANFLQPCGQGKEIAVLVKS